MVKTALPVDTSSGWVPPDEYPELLFYSEIQIDLVARYSPLVLSPFAAGIAIAAEPIR
ncbi:MAG: hypothetical protein OXJ64_20630 [Boseongicola sp.]|nr:hypothetical protein [Boseongicola sp.]